VTGFIVIEDGPAGAAFRGQQPPGLPDPFLLPVLDFRMSVGAFDWSPATGPFGILGFLGAGPTISSMLFGADRVTDAGLPMMGAEDFSFYLERVPGAYFFLGGGVDGEDCPPCHSARYDFNDDLILRGVRCWLRLVERTLGCELA